MNGFGGSSLQTVLRMAKRWH